jgi:hypothetical protein
METKEFCVHTHALRIDKKAPLPKSKDVRSKTPAEESSLRFVQKAGAEGATAPETLRPTDRSGMTLWKAAFLQGRPTEGGNFARR